MHDRYFSAALASAPCCRAHCSSPWFALRPFPARCPYFHRCCAIFAPFSAAFPLMLRMMQIYLWIIIQGCLQRAIRVGTQAYVTVTCHAARQGDSAEDHGPRAATILTGLIHQPDCVFSFLFSDFAIAGEREVLARPAPLPVWEALGGADGGVGLRAAWRHGKVWIDIVLFQVHFSNSSPFRWGAAGPVSPSAALPRRWWCCGCRWRASKHSVIFIYFIWFELN